MKKFKIWTYICLCSAILFSLVNINFAFNVSVFAFPLSAVISAFLVYFAYFKLFAKWEYKDARVVKKLMEYMPFVFLAAFILRRAGGIMNPDFSLVGVVPYWYDVICVLLWTVNFISCQGSLYFLNDKRIKNLNEKWQKITKDSSSDKSFKKLFFEVIDWVDAIVQAVCMVLLFQIFILQLYVIPSESMVPEFLVKDRVVVFKTASGPKFPLSDVGLPTLKDYKRGDIVVFRNPHYDNSRKSEVKNFVSQLVYMLTFTTVNLNVDENGQLKADPLVKRITGVPGEQLMMQDGILYSRTQDSPTFTPVKEDALWAEWNVAGIPESTKKDIIDIPLTEEQYKTMLEVEDLRNNLDLVQVASECREIAQSFTQIRNRQNFNGKLPASADIPRLFSNEELTMYNLFSNDMSITLKLLSVTGGAEWFTNFLTSWISATPKDNLYDQAMFKLDVMAKLELGKLILRNAELNLEGATSNQRRSDPVRQAALDMGNKLYMYSVLNNSRNMPIFPANDANGNPQFIPEHNYFMMGDNRFNSLDMRHSYSEKLIPISEADSTSLYYYSSVEPQYVSRERILGNPVLRFLPLSRFGVPGLTGEKSK